MFIILKITDSPESMVMITDGDEISKYKTEFMEGLDKTIFRENHPYKFYNINGKPDWMKVAKIINRIATLKGVHVEALASDTKLQLQCDSWPTECHKLPLLLFWFKRFYRHQRKYKEFLELI